MPTLDLVETLCDLVSIPSVNPMGRPVSGPEFFEYKVTEYLQALFDRLGLPWERQPIEPQRENIVARLDGAVPPEEGGPLIMFEAHQDTVPVDGMIIDPWTPAIKDGRIYGRGSCDIKGGMCAMLGAVARLAQERPSRNRPTIIMACSVNEEHGYTGAAALPKLWERSNSIIPRQPDLAIVAEPTGLNVVRAHKGACRWRCHAKGRAVHSSRPHLGDNAIYRMARVALALEAYQREFVPTLPVHPWCGSASLSVGTISGGISVNTVPDECVIEIDRRILPGEEGWTIFKQVTEFIAARLGDDAAKVVHEEPYMLGLALPDTHNGPLAERLQTTAQQVYADCQQIGVPYGTDAAVISSSGVPSVVFGPGSIDQAHTADEWLELSQLEQASEILYQFAKQGW